MSQLSFAIYKEMEDGSLVLDKDVDVSNLTAEKDGSPYSTTFINNGDGTYQFPVTENGDYTVKLNGAAQDEFKLVPVCTPADTLSDSANLKSSATKGYIEKDGSDELKVKDGETMLLEADIVNDLTTGGSTEPLSAEQGKTLKTTVDGKEAADVTILKEADLNSNLTTGGTDKAVQAEVLKDELVQSYANPTYIGESKTIPQNLDILDQIVAAFSSGNALAQYRTIYTEKKVAGTSPGNTPGSYTVWTETSTSYVAKIKFEFNKQSADTKILHNYKVKISNASYYYAVELAIDGNVYHSIGLGNDTAYLDVLDEIDLSSVADGIHTIEIKIISDNVSGTVSYTEPIIQVRSN